MMCYVHSENFFHLNNVLKHVEESKYHNINSQLVTIKRREAAKCKRMIFVRRNSHGARKKPPISAMLILMSAIGNPRYVWRKSLDYLTSHDLVFYLAREHGIFKGEISIKCGEHKYYFHYICNGYWVFQIKYGFG